jgi:hypothetical protein
MQTRSYSEDASAVEDEREPDERDDRPPICPACGVTMGIVLDERESPRFVCLECGFSEGEGL